MACQLSDQPVFFFSSPFFSSNCIVDCEKHEDFTWFPFCFDVYVTRLETGHFIPTLFYSTSVCSTIMYHWPSSQHWQIRECYVTGLLSHADMIRYLSLCFTFLSSRSRTQMPIEPLWPWDKSETNEDFPRCQNSSNASCESGQKQHTVFRAKWKHKISGRISKSRRGLRLCCLWMDAASLRLHWAVICDLFAGVCPSWVRCGQDEGQHLQVRGRGSPLEDEACPLQGRVEHLLWVDEFRLPWVWIQQGFLIGTQWEWKTTCVRRILSPSLKDCITI